MLSNRIKGLLWCKYLIFVYSRVTPLVIWWPIYCNLLLTVYLVDCKLFLTTIYHAQAQQYQTVAIWHFTTVNITTLLVKVTIMNDQCLYICCINKCEHTKMKFYLHIYFALNIVNISDVRVNNLYHPPIH